MNREERRRAALRGAANSTKELLLRSIPLSAGAIILSCCAIIFIPKEGFALLFGERITGAIIAAMLGTLSDGNPLLGYLLPGELGGRGIGLAPALAFLLTWSGVAVLGREERRLLGGRFVLVRNSITIFLIVIVALLLAALGGRV